MTIPTTDLLLPTDTAVNKYQECRAIHNKKGCTENLWILQIEGHVSNLI